MFGKKKKEENLKKIKNNLTEMERDFYKVLQSNDDLTVEDFYRKLYVTFRMLDSI